jgi:hypothetical protein
VAPNSPRSSKTRRTLLALVLVVAEPAGLALVASNLVTTIADRGVAAIAWLVVRLLITGFGAGVGMALWRERPGALNLARWAVGLAFAAAMITALTPVWPHPLPPGVREPATVLLFVWYAGWFGWTLRGGSDRVGSGRIGSDRVGSGSDRVGSGQIRLIGLIGSARLLALPDPIRPDPTRSLPMRKGDTAQRPDPTRHARSTIFPT